MIYKPNMNFSAQFVTQRFDTGVATDADTLPVATASKNCVDDATFVLTVTKMATGRYKITGTIPSNYVTGDTVDISVVATVNTKTGTDIIKSFMIDTALISDIPALVWAVTTRTLSSFGTLIADIWSNITRTLSDKAGFSLSADYDAAKDAASSTLVTTGVNAIRDDISNIQTGGGGSTPAEIWSHPARTLTSAYTDEQTPRDMAGAAAVVGSKALAITLYRLGTTTPIINARVSILNSTGTVTLQSNLTDSNGKVETTIDNGIYLFRYSCPSVNFEITSEMVTIDTDKTITRYGTAIVPLPPEEDKQNVLIYPKYPSYLNDTSVELYAEAWPQKNNFFGKALFTPGKTVAVLNEDHFEMQLTKGARFKITGKRDGVIFLEKFIAVTQDDMKDLDTYTE